MQHQLTDSNQIAQLILAGNARITLQNTATSARFTFRIRQPKKEAPHFVGVLTGSNNESDYTFLGTIFDNATYAHGKKSSIGVDAPSAKAFLWFFQLVSGKLTKTLSDFPQLQVFHEGKCCRCGRTLTTPESIQAGLGPECIKHLS